jgi:transposase
MQNMIQIIMPIANTPLPENYAALQAFAATLQQNYALLEHKYAELETGNEVLRTEVHHKALHIEKLKAQLAVLRRARFGQSSEKLDRQIVQVELLLGELEASAAESKAPSQQTSLPRTTGATCKRTASRRGTLPLDLPRERVEHVAACECPACGGKRLTCIGKDEREVIEYVPSYFKVIVHSRPKMSCRDCEKITQPPMPSMPIVRGMAGPGLLAHIMVARFDDHLPYYRQSEIYARDGIELDRSMLAEWMGHMSCLLEPLTEAIGRHVREGQTIHADDTTLPVLEPGHGKTRTGRLWVALRDERTWGSTAPPAVYYRYAPDRTREQAEALLEGCTGYLHADAYSGYKRLYNPDPITGLPQLLEVACWAHARRYIFDEHKRIATPATEELLIHIGELFAIEATIKGLTPLERKNVRLEHAVPKLVLLKGQYETVLRKISAKSEFAKALRYALSRWSSFTRYTTDGRLEICNNAVERQIRPVAVGRKNWMFAGSDDGGKRAASAFTLIETAKINGLNPEVYLRDIIGRVADHPINRIGDLLPWNMKGTA